MKKVIAILALSLLAGCAAKPVARDTHEATEKWAQSVVRDTQDRISEPEQYAGQKCTLRVFLMPSGAVTGVNAEGGDPELCQAAIAAVRKTTYQPLPAELQKQKSIVFDFKL